MNYYEVCFRLSRNNLKTLFFSIFLKLLLKYLHTFLPSILDDKNSEALKKITLNSKPTMKLKWINMFELSMN